MDNSSRGYRPVMHRCDHDKEASSSIKFNKRDYLGSCWFVADPSSQYLILSENLFQVVFI